MKIKYKFTIILPLILLKLKMQKGEIYHQAKGGLALGSAIGTFLPYAALGYTAAIYKALHPGKELPDFYRNIAGNCARMMERISLKTILGVRTEIEGVLPETDPENERQIYISNHPTSNGVPGIMSFVTSNFAPHFLAISKKENLRHPTAPLNFWPLKLMDALIFIDRQSGKEAIDQIRESTQRILSNNSGLLIFPDQNRPTQKAIDYSVEKHGPVVTDQPQYTCAPRRGGLASIIEATKEVPTRFLTLTTAYNRKDETLADAGKLSGATLHFEARDVTEEMPRNEAELGEWLNAEWVRKNRLIHDWKSA